MPWRVRGGTFSGSDLPFVGRQNETDRLRTRLARAWAGQGGPVMLAGEPGIGKTRLADVLGRVAEQDGWTVLRGRCYEGDAASPYSPFAEALRDLFRKSDPSTLRRWLGYGAPTIARIVIRGFSDAYGS